MEYVGRSSVAAGQLGFGSYLRAIKRLSVVAGRATFMHCPLLGLVRFVQIFITLVERNLICLCLSGYGLCLYMRGKDIMYFSICGNDTRSGHICLYVWFTRTPSSVIERWKIILRYTTVHCMI